VTGQAGLLVLTLKSKPVAVPSQTPNLCAKFILRGTRLRHD
jgi:hypothetical protein